MDIGPNSIAHRKVSIIVQLSDEKDYTGGDFQIHTGRGIQALSKEKGMVAIFPSYLLHRVTPVLSGTRKSLVLWAGGGHYQ
jgi:PKHD-type hydroxylase